MHIDFEMRASEYRRALPGLVRAALVDHGISTKILDCREIGWNDRRVAIPIRGRAGNVIFFEQWDAASIGKPLPGAPSVELFPWTTLNDPGDYLLIVEGVHEALVPESQGFPAIAATGSGRSFKQRDWAAAVASIPQVVVAYRRGEKLERRRFLQSRSELAAKVHRTIPHASVLEWPEAVGDNGGAYEFFVTLGKTKDDFEELLSRAA